MRGPNRDKESCRAPPMTHLLVCLYFGAACLGLVSAVEPACEFLQGKSNFLGSLGIGRSCAFLPDPPQPFAKFCLSFCPQLGQTCEIPQEPILSIMPENMLYFNYEIPAENVHILEEEIGLPDGFQIAPVAILEGESPTFYMSLNFYTINVQDATSIRSEWSTYVTKEGDPNPRFMVIEIESSQDSVLPYPPFSIHSSTAISYETNSDDSVHVSALGIQASFGMPTNGDVTFMDLMWAKANDALYFTNGVADAALYNSEFFETPLRVVDPSTINISGTSKWLLFLSTEPANTFLYSKTIEFLFSPFFNLSDLNLPYEDTVQNVKEAAFGLYSFGQAFQAFTSAAEPILRFRVENIDVPSVYINFAVSKEKKKEFELALDLPPGFKLAPSKMTAQTSSQLTLTLNIYQTLDSLTGMLVNRAEWFVYVLDRNDPSAGGIYPMVITVESSGASLDPVGGFTDPNPNFLYSQISGSAGAEIKDLFTINFNVPSLGEDPVELLDRWTFAQDRTYWLNGIYDELFYNGLLLDAEVSEVTEFDFSAGISMPWAEYIDDEPEQVLVFHDPIEFSLHPWKNMEELCGV